MEQITVLSKNILATLTAPLELADGTVIPAGRKVLLLPETTAECVLTPDGESLAAAWPAISRAMAGSESVNENLIEYGAEITRFSTRQAQLELALVDAGSAITRNANNISSLGTQVAALSPLATQASANTLTVVSDPEFELPLQMENTGEISIAVSARSLLVNGEISAFLVSSSELAIEEAVFSAEGNSAVAVLSVFDYMSRQEVGIAIVAVDNMGNRSRIIKKSVLLVKNEISEPNIIAPQNGETVSVDNLVIKVAPMEVIGDIADTAKYLRVQVSENADFSSLVFDSGVASAPPDSLEIQVDAALPKGVILYARARWTGEFLGESIWCGPVAFATGI